ncbi:MAG: histidine kinase N-terminal 7TM domain-containing protein [Bacteroidales bacterium]
MNVYVFLSFVALILYIEAGIYVLFSLPASRTKYLFVALCFAFSLHSLFYLVSPFFSEVSRVYLLDKVAAVGWVTFPVLIVEMFYSLSRSRGIFLRKMINIILIPAAFLFLFRYWYDASSVKEFYQHNNIWYYAADMGNIWFAGFVVYLLSCVVTSLIILLQWKRLKESSRERLKVNILLISLVLFFLASIVSNLLYPVTGNTSLPALSYFNALPLGIGLFYTLVHLRQKPFSPEVISNLISSRIREFVFYLDQNAKIYAANRFSLENLKYIFTKVEETKVRIKIRILRPRLFQLKRV